MYDEHVTPYNDTAARWWAIVAFLMIALIFMFGGLGVTVWLGGKEWARIYAVAVGVLVILAALFGGIYAIMALLVSHGLGLQRSNADLLHAHSQSGAQQARAVTEVIRGANAINKADADTQQEMIRGFSRIGQEYERQLAKMAGRAIEAEQRAALPPPAADDGMPQYLLPAEWGNAGNANDEVVYRMPNIK